MSNQKKTEQGKRPCHFFLNGLCKNGAQCSYSHDLDDKAITEHAVRQARSQASQDKLRLWRFKIPKPQDLRRAIPLGSRAREFILIALELVDTDAESMQEVLTSLSSEGGLRRIGELIDIENLTDLSQARLDDHFDNLILPLLRIVSHEGVLISAIVENRHATILNYLYGVNGRRCIALFMAILKIVPTKLSALSPCIVTLAYIYVINSSAQLNEDLTKLATELLSIADGVVLEGSAARHLKCLRTRIGLVEQIQDAPDNSQRARTPISDLPKFKIEHDRPGELSAHGPRHDNDKELFEDIAVMPTASEILSDRTEYLPTNDPDDWHIGGMKGLLDRQFRLLREDTVGQLRDAAKYELARLRDPDFAVSKDKKQQGARTRRYTNVALSDIIFDPFKGLLLILTFDQPQSLQLKSLKQRQEFWEETRHLDADSLVCLLGSNGYTAFLTIAQPLNPRGDKVTEKSARLANNARWADTRTASILARLVDDSPAEVEALLNALGPGQITTRCSYNLLEFPGMLLPAFKPTLDAIQNMSTNHEAPFADILGPQQDVSNDHRHIPPPLYASHRDFRFDLSCLVNDGSALHLDPAHPISAQQLCERSSLDLGQAQAIISALSHSFAMIQGPPGTGKSFTGGKLMEVLLANRRKGGLNSVLFTSFTNHALDQALEHHVDAGVKQIIRMGRQSKSARLSQLGLHDVAMQHSNTKLERSVQWQTRNNIEKASKSINTVLASLRNCRSKEAISTHLRANAPLYHMQLFQSNTSIDEEGVEWRTVGHVRTFDEWLEEEIPAYGPVRENISLLAETDLDTMVQEERQRMYEIWVNEMLEPIYADLLDKLALYREEKALLDTIKHDSYLRVLSKASIVGVTTSGLARNLEFLRRLNSKVLVVEEAGEVLEAHILTALLPSIEHVILIGDHQQLRPKAQNYDLSCENPRSQTTLDISLFERLVEPKPGFARLPYSTLNTQRRMHPDISNIIRQTSYPALVDAPRVHDHQPVLGMKHRLYWLDHAVLEDSQSDDLHNTSHTNSFEVEMVASLVRHVVNQGVYGAEDIAVLTPYLGQLRKLRGALSAFSNIVMDERDNEELALEGEEDKLEEFPKPTYKRGSLLQAVRLATVDNFQGEEAKVVIISLVRSNKSNKYGFLRIPNRINVTLSRAKCGMFIIGNADTAASVPMWKQVIDLLGDERVGPMLHLSCPRHPETPLEVKNPDDFMRLAPEAGCQRTCDNLLQCGHSCSQKCHSDVLHEAVMCLKPCTRLVEGCTHLCPKECGLPCSARCQQMISDLDIQLVCGHRITKLPCWLHQDQSRYQCIVKVERTVPGCLHKVTTPCFIKLEKLQHNCPAVCNANLACGHSCQRDCKSCRYLNKDSEPETDHGRCDRTCGRLFTTCAHACKAKCHGNEPCPPCRAVCQKSCMHGKCGKKCHEPCAPCAESVCGSSCKHSKCTMPCAAPCDWVPCSQRCEKTLGCGHQCPSLCSRPCPGVQFCQVCASEDIKGMRADLVMLSTYAEVDLDESPCIILDCGHIFTIDSLDGIMNMSEYYNLDASGMPESLKGPSLPFSYKELKSCPDCRASLAGIERYGRIVKRAILDESTKKFISWSMNTYMPLATDLQAQQLKLLDSRNAFKVMKVDQSDDPDQKISSMAKLIQLMGNGHRYTSINTLRQRIVAFSKRVVVDEQPFQRVKELVEIARRRAAPRPGPDAFNFDNTILETRGELLTSALLMRLDAIIYNDMAFQWQKCAMRPIVKINFDRNRTVCEELIHRAESSKYPLQQVEGHLYWAQFAALESMFIVEGRPARSDLDILRRSAGQHLDFAQELCDKYPAQTGNAVHDEVVDARRMLDEASASEMKMIVKAMGKEWSGTGHWWRCENGHPFTIGECGMPMALARCPDCGAAIGGSNHAAAPGVTGATDIERDFGELRLQ